MTEAEPQIVARDHSAELPDEKRVALEAVIRRQDLMFASISHELRTPLNGIVGLTELVLAAPEISEDSQRRLRVVKNQAMRLNSLVDDILDAASSKRGHLTVKHGKCDLREISESVCTMVQPLVCENVVLLNNVSRGGDSILEGDGNRISQILTNLLGNAIKFTKTGSITIRNRTGRDTVVVEVEDTGIGVADDKLAKIWDAFESVDELADSKYASTGLGLSLVKSLVEAHGGSCWVSSRFGVANSGTIFSFSLPRFQARASSSPALQCVLSPAAESAMLTPLQKCQSLDAIKGLKTQNESLVDAAEARRASLDALKLMAKGGSEIWMPNTNTDERISAETLPAERVEEESTSPDQLQERVRGLEDELRRAKQELSRREQAAGEEVQAVPAITAEKKSPGLPHDADAPALYRKLESGLAARAEREKARLARFLCEDKTPLSKTASWSSATTDARTSSSEGESRERPGRYSSLFRGARGARVFRRQPTI